MSTQEIKETGKYKGVEIFSDRIKHNKQDNKIVIKFTLNGTDYVNGTLVPVNASEEHQSQEFEKLLEWAKTIINDHEVK